MNILLAAQTLSSTVTKAVDFVWSEIARPFLKKVKQLLNLFKKVDVGFDMMNSRNPFAKGFNAPMTLENLPEWRKNVMKLQHAYLL